MKTPRLFRYSLQFLILVCCLVSVISTEALARTASPQAAASSPKLYPKSYALVIGVNEPQGEWAPLNSAQDDAQMFANHLKQIGFDVTLLLGDRANKQEILRQLQTQLPKKVTKSDRFIFYFAGHGQTQTLGQGKKVGYVVPHDGMKASSQDQWHTYLSMRELRSLLTEHILSKHTLLIFDSCFSGLMFTRGGLRRPNLGAQSHLKRSGVMAITAGGEGELALDGLFTPTFIQALSGEADENGDGITSFQEVALYTRREVRVRQGEQNPQFGVISGTGQMIFKSDVAANGLPVLSQQPASPSAQANQVSGPSLSTRLGVPTPIGSGLSSEQAFWTTATITSGVVSLAGAGLMMYAHGRHQDLLSEPSDELYNKRLRTEGSDIVGQNNAGVVMLAIGGGALMFSVYQLLTSPSAPTSASSADTSSALSVTPDPLNRSVSLEVTW